jgi:hypothetical protein
MSKPKKGRYQQKIDLGLVPHSYNKDSASFKAGAWKNLGEAERRTNERALGLRN